MDTKVIQKARIIQALNLRGRITNRDIFVDLNINSPTARISDLRKDGYNILDFREQGTEGTTPHKVYYRGPDQFNNFFLDSEDAARKHIFEFFNNKE